MEILGISLLCLLVVIISYFYLRWYKYDSNCPPGPWNLPIVGHLPWLDPKAPYLSLTKLSQTFGPVYGLYLGNIYTVVISDVKLVKKFFSKDATAGRAPLFLTHGIMKESGLICTQGELSKNQRKVVHDFLRSLCTEKSIDNKKKIEEIVSKHVIDLIRHIKNLGSETKLNPAQLLRHSIGSVATEIVLGKAWARDDETWMQLQHMQEVGTAYMGVTGPLNFLSFLRFLPKYQKPLTFLKEEIHKMHKIFKQIIDEEERSFQVDQTPSNLIQAYIAAKINSKGTNYEHFFNEQQFSFVLSDMFGAGLDTSLNTLTFFLLYVSKYQQVQTKMRQELDKVLQGNPPTLNDLSSLPYVKATIAEVQRIQTIAPLGIPHAALDDVEIGGFNIRKGTMIVALLWAIHMDPKKWYRPDIFKPERFLNEEGNFNIPESFIPYAVGKRMCMGDEVAKILLFLFSATIVQNFQIEFKDPNRVDLNGDCGITITPKPHELIFKKTKS